LKVVLDYIIYIFLHLHPNSHIGAQLNIGTTLRLGVTVSLCVIRTVQCNRNADTVHKKSVLNQRHV